MFSLSIFPFLLYRQSGLGYSFIWFLLDGSVSPLIIVLEELWVVHPPETPEAVELTRYLAAWNCLILKPRIVIKGTECVKEDDQL